MHDTLMCLQQGYRISGQLPALRWRQLHLLTYLQTCIRLPLFPPPELCPAEHTPICKAEPRNTAKTPSCYTAAAAASCCSTLTAVCKCMAHTAPSRPQGVVRLNLTRPAAAAAALVTSLL